MSREIPFAASSHVKSVVYDDETQILTVGFARATYIYKGVDGNTADGFSTAPSAGRYLDQFIKGQYEYEKVG